MPDPESPDGLRDLDRLVEDWFFRAFHGSVVARTTEVWNHVHAAKEELKQALKRHLAALLDGPAKD